MADQSAYPYPSPTTQLEQLAGAAQQASSPTADYDATQQRPPNPRKRRADGSAVSTRGVANLTPDQLAKKRANDREAQRAIRERTRHNIETLERRIKELEAQQPFVELQSVVRSRDAVIAENEDLKKRLASICTLAQYAVAGHGLNDLALATSQQAPLPLPGTQPQHQSQPDSSHYTHDEDATQTMSQQHIHPDLRSLQGHAPTASMQSNGTTPGSSDTKSELRDWQRLPLHYDMPQDLPSTPAPTNELDSALNSIVASHRAALEAGTGDLGPATPSFAALVDGPFNEQETPSLAADVASLINHHLGSTDLPKRVATMYIAYALLQWIISPSQESFSRLPEWLVPTQLQLERPHNTWVDLLPWPQSRDRAVSNPAQHGPAFFYSTFNSLAVEWPYDPNLCLLKADHDDWTINPVFAEHLSSLDNWSLSTDTRDEGLEGLLQGLGSSANEVSS